MYKQLLKKITVQTAITESDTASKSIDEKKLDAITGYLVSNFGYSVEQVKAIMRSATNNKFDINSKLDREKLIFTALDVLSLEVINKHNNIFLTLTKQVKAPIVTITDMTQISLNATPEIQVFVSPEERLAIDSFNEEARYVRTHFGS